MGYFHTPPTKRQEALQVIGQILSYSREEMTEVCMYVRYDVVPVFICRREMTEVFVLHYDVVPVFIH